VTRPQPAVLARAIALVEPPLREAVRTLPEPLWRPVAYHFGWVDVGGGSTPGHGGKGVRAALAILSAEAAGAAAAVGVPGAVAVELVHNFSLVHDDVIDNDRERRHRPTVWAQFGVPEALIAGDAMHTLAFQVLLADPTPERFQATSELATATAAMISGQRADMAFDGRLDVSVAECSQMEGDKTGALLAYSAAVGAVLAGAEDELVKALGRYGMELGLAFQAIDDLLGIWGDPSVTGKPAGNDLRERKKSLPVAVAMASDAAARDELEALFSQAELLEADLTRAAELVDVAGGRQATVDIASAHMAAALGSLAESGARPVAATELAELADFIVEREF
jgi:geranylgeranyl diphosphate synthase type I